MPTEGGTLCGSQGMNFPYALSQLLTQSGQLGTFEALAELATNAIVSGMTPDNVFEEMFRSPPP